MPSVVYAALHGRNIPHAPTLTEAKVRAALQRLPASMTYLRIVGRPDSVLIGATEDDVRRAVSAAVDCRCVAISMSTTSRIVDEAVVALRAHGLPATPPYRITADGMEWEWCLVLSSETLPGGLPENAWLFEPTATVQALAVVGHRALLARKHRFTGKGEHLPLGNRLLHPWQKVLDANRVSVSCITSRTLNRVAEVISAASQFEH